MKSTTLIAILLSIVVQEAGARDQTARPNASEFKKTNNNSGLCTSDNKGQAYYDEGYCKALYEAMTGKSDKRDFSCFKDLVEDLRKRNADETGKLKPFELSISCDQGKKGRGTTADIAKDPAKWTSFLMQVFSMFVIQESEWDVKKDKDSSKKGLLRITKESMDDPKYKCGCNNEPIQNDPIDGHQNIICGAYQALYWASKDGVLFEGFDGRKGKSAKQGYESPQEKPRDDKDERRGFSRIFESAAYNPDDKKSLARHEWIDKKSEKYCQDYAHTASGDASRTGKFDADMTPDNNSLSPTPGISN